jgi:hypothetical protein
LKAEIRNDIIYNEELEQKAGEEVATGFNYRMRLKSHI